MRTVSKKDFIATKNHGTLSANRTYALSTFKTMLPDHRRIGIKAEIDDLAVTQRGYLYEHGLARVEDCRSLRQHDIDLGTQHIKDLFGSFDIKTAEMLLQLQVRKDTHLAAVVGKPFAKNTVSAIFENSGIDRAIHQNIPGGLPLRLVSSVNLPIIQIKTVTAGKAGMLAGNHE